MDVVSSFTKDTWHYLFVGHGAINEGDKALKKSQQDDENVVINEGEGCSKVNEKGVVAMNDPSTPLPGGQSCIQDEVWWAISVWNQQ